MNPRCAAPDGGRSTESNVGRGSGPDLAGYRRHVSFAARRGRLPTPVHVGVSGQDTVVGISQGWRLFGAIKRAGRKLADETLVHGGQALIAWVGKQRVLSPKATQSSSRSRLQAPLKLIR